MKSNDKLDCLPEVKDKPYEKPEEGDLECLAVHFGQRLYKKYGLETLRKIDEANVPLKDTIYDAVYDYIDMTGQTLCLGYYGNNSYKTSFGAFMTIFTVLLTSWYMYSQIQ